MAHVQNMISAHPNPMRLDADALAACIEACFDCEQACTACADACLAEDMVQDLTRCIRVDLDCADVCATTGRILSRQTKPDQNLIRAQVQALAQAVKTCGDECERHADRHEHCRVCMESCRRCEESCNEVLSQLGSMAQA